MVVGFCGGGDGPAPGMWLRCRASAHHKTAECLARTYGGTIVSLGLEHTVPHPLEGAVGFLGGRTVSRVSPHPRAGLSAAMQGSAAVVAGCREQAEEDPEIRSAWTSLRTPRMHLATWKHIDPDM